MSRRGSKNKLAHTDLALGTTVVAIALLLVGLVLLRSKSARSLGPQRFPIDGMAAECGGVTSAAGMLAIADTSAKLIRNRIPGGRLAGDGAWGVKTALSGPSFLWLN